MGVIDDGRIKSTIDIMQKAFPMKNPVQPQDMYVPGFVE
jgi:hypothetical protein